MEIGDNVIDYNGKNGIIVSLPINNDDNYGVNIDGEIFGYYSREISCKI